MCNTTSQKPLHPAEFDEQIKKICQTLKEKDRILVCGHVRPDGDCIGSQTSMYFLLKDMGKTVRMYNRGPVLPHFQSFPGVENIELEIDDSYKPEVCVFLDCGAKNRVLDEDVGCDILINIDHHKSNESFGDINYVDTKATAVGEQVFHIVTAMGIPLTKKVASAIYLAILSDSGSFRFSNTSSMTFAVASAAVEAGADPAKIAAALFENRTRESVNLKARVLSKLNYECGGRLVWSEITQEEYQANGGEDNEPESTVSEMRGIVGVEASILFHELEQGGMRAGLRSKSDVDVSIVASQMGGGGHPNASGCYIPGDYRELRDKLLSLAVDYINSRSPLK